MVIKTITDCDNRKVLRTSSSRTKFFERLFLSLKILIKDKTKQKKKVKKIYNMHTVIELKNYVSKGSKFYHLTFKTIYY